MSDLELSWSGLLGGSPEREETSLELGEGEEFPGGLKQEEERGRGNDVGIRGAASVLRGSCI